MPGRGVHPLLVIRIAQHVQPVAAITNTVLLAGQKPVNNLLPGVRRSVLEKGVLLSRGGAEFRSGRDKLFEARSAYRLCATGLRPCFLVPIGNECVDWVRRVRYPRRNRWTDDGLKRPESRRFGLRRGRCYLRPAAGRTAGRFVVFAFWPFRAAADNAHTTSAKTAFPCDYGHCR